MREHQMPDDPIEARLIKAGLPITRENYIKQDAWGHEVEEEGVWNAEYERMLPEHLQNWSLFDAHGRYHGPPPYGK